MAKMNKCPECGKKGNKEYVDSDSYETVEIYTCRNDEGFILPDCNVAQWKVVFNDMGISKDVQMQKTEAV